MVHRSQWSWCRCLPALLLALSAVLCLLQPALADSGRGKHKKMYAVPCPGKVVIDGKLDDWDLSGQLFMYIMQETSEMMSAKFAIMYDNEALYLSGDVRDDTPLMNRHDPHAGDAQFGWNADSCQFRLVIDPSQGYPLNQGSFDPVPNQEMVHLLLWYYTDKQEPVLQMQTGMNYAVPHADWQPYGLIPKDHYQAAYLKHDDGKGYTFEYRIPWATLMSEKHVHPKAGDLVSSTVQFNYSTPDGMTAGGGWLYDNMSGPGFTFQSSACWGKLIFSDKGNLPRDLVEEGVPPAPPMPLTFQYTLPEAAETTIQLFDEHGQVVRNLVASAARGKGVNTERWDGLDDAGKPLPAGNYTWKGLYHQPLKTKFIMSVHNSGNPPYKTDDNTGGWGGDHGICTTTCALPDGMLMAWNVCESGWGIVRTDLTGKRRWGSRSCATDLAVSDTRIFAANNTWADQQDQVLLFDLADCRPLPFGNGSSYLLPPPGGNGKADNKVTGLAYRAGKVYVAYQARNLVGVYDAVQGTLLDTLTVPTPQRLVARADGTLAVISGEQVLVVKGGKTTPLVTNHLDKPVGIAEDSAGQLYVANCGTLQNISVFTAEGKYLRSIGKTGGRPRMGRYDANGILEPGGISVDAKGRLWVAETLDGPKRVSVWDTKSGKFAQEFFGGSAYSTVVRMDPKHPDEVYCHDVLWKVNLNKGTWKAYSTVWRESNPNMVKGTYDLNVITAKNGHQYGWGIVNYSSVLYMRVGDVFKPILCGIDVLKANPYVYWPLYEIFRDNKKYPDGTYVWQDQNDDQTIQANELTTMEGRAESVFNVVDADLNLWSNAGFVLRPVRFAKDGRPIYDFNKREKFRVPTMDGGARFAVDPQDGSFYTLGGTWGRWTLDGKQEWSYKGCVGWQDAVNLPPVTPGKLYGPDYVLGTAGDYTGLVTYFGPFHLYTRDGLFVGSVMRDGRVGGGLGPDIIACENFNGQLVKPEGMNRYFLLAGDQDGRITEILGLDTVKRLPGGTYVHTAEAAKTATDALTEYQSKLAKGSKLEIARGRQNLNTAKGIQKIVDDTRGFTVRAAYDAQNLYVAYDVTSPYELTNSIVDPHTIFKGGNLLDIQLATDPAADEKRKTPAVGDVRILVTRQNGKPAAMLFHPRVKDFTGTPIVLKSPTGQESFDTIESSDAVKLDYTPKAGGFNALVTIPLSLIGWTPKAGGTVRMDLGYIFSKNATGSQAAMRAYWSNNSFSANIVDDVPNESRLEPGEWGTATVE